MNSDLACCERLSVHCYVILTVVLYKWVLQMLYNSYNSEILYEEFR